MEDVIKNFTLHLRKIMDDNIANRFESQMKMKNFSPNADLEHIENDLQLTLSNILLNYSEDNIRNLSNSIYEKFIENDDKNIIQAVKFLIRFYSKNQELKMLSYFYKWRRVLFTSNFFLNKEKSLPQSSQKNDKFSSSKSEKTNNVLLSKNNKTPSQNMSNQPNTNQVDFTKDYLDKNVKEMVNNNNNVNKSETPDIFNKLYVDSYRKQNKILLNEEIKKLSELGSCTFKPTIRKYNFDEN